MGKLISLADGTKAGSPLKVSMRTETHAEIYIYAMIGQDYWKDGSAISAKQFSDEMNKLPSTVKDITLRINSPGGDVFDGITIFNRLKQHKAKKKVYIDGLAASISSIIALAGDEILMGDGALYMVHLPWAFMCGGINSVQADKLSDDLRVVEEQMIGIYARKSGLTRQEVRSMLEKETWMGYDDAKKYGFVDGESEDTVAIAASALKQPFITRAPDASNLFTHSSAAQEKLNDVLNKLSGMTRK